MSIPQHRHLSSAGFTLIEVMIVIAILGGNGGRNGSSCRSHGG